MEVLQKIDIFSTPITFKIMNNEKYHSLIGVSLSLIIMISTILFTYFFGMDFVFHLESNILQSTRTNKTYEFFNLSMDEFFIAWQIEGEYYDEVNFTNILYPILNYYSYKSDNRENIEYKRCKNYNFSSKIPDDIKNYFCMDMSKYSQGGGFENENKIEFLYMYIDMCGINTINNNYSCSIKNDFQKLMNEYGQIYMVVYYPIISFLPEEDIPYQISYNKKNIPLNTKFFTQDRFYIRKYIFEDDNGWAVPKINTYKLFGISDIDTSYTFNDIDEINEENRINNFIYYANFYIDRKYAYHKRSFTKLFESLSLVVAFYETIYAIFYFVSSFCNEFLLLETIMINTQGNLSPIKITNPLNDKYEHLNANIMDNKEEQSKTPFKYADNNINILNNNIKRNNYLLPRTNKENGTALPNDNTIKNTINKENNKKLNNIINLDANSSKKKSIYSLLLLYIFHFFLREKKKYRYQINYMNRKTFKKKLDIYNYLTLMKRVDFLFLQLQRCKNKILLTDKK